METRIKVGPAVTLHDGIPADNGSQHNRDKDHIKDELNLDLYLPQLTMLQAPAKLSADLTLVSGQWVKSAIDRKAQNSELMNISTADVPVMAGKKYRAGAPKSLSVPAKKEIGTEVLTKSNKVRELPDSALKPASTKTDVLMAETVISTKEFTLANDLPEGITMSSIDRTPEKAVHSLTTKMLDSEKMDEDKGAELSSKGNERSALAALLPNLSSVGDKHTASSTKPGFLQAAEKVRNNIDNAHKQMAEQRGTSGVGETRLNFTFRRWGEGVKHSVQISTLQNGSLPAVMVPSDPLVGQRLSASLTMPDAPALLMREDQGEQHRQRHSSAQNEIEDEDA